MYCLESSCPIGTGLGRQGREFFKRHYAWPVIERKYPDMFERLKRDTTSRPADPWPGWWHRRQRILPPARDVLAQAPAGPSTG